MIRYALLALLREQSDYGYRLKRRFEERMGPAVRLTHSYVYQTLRTLARQGLVAELPATREDPRYPARRAFAITHRGERAHDRWMAQRPTAQRPRSRRDTLIRALWCGAEQSRLEPIRLHLDDQERAHRLRLTRLLGARRRLAARRGSTLLADLAIEGEILEVRAQLDWLAVCRRQLHGVPAQGETSPGVPVRPAVPLEGQPLPTPALPVRLVASLSGSVRGSAMHRRAGSEPPASRPVDHW
jgi:DNA-binding PadR family transcriptional regulator